MVLMDPWRHSAFSIHGSFDWYVFLGLSFLLPPPPPPPPSHLYPLLSPDAATISNLFPLPTGAFAGALNSPTPPRTSSRYAPTHLGFSLTRPARQTGLLLHLVSRHIPLGCRIIILPHSPFHPLLVFPHLSSSPCPVDTAPSQLWIWDRAVVGACPRSMYRGLKYIIPRPALVPRVAHGPACLP